MSRRAARHAVHTRYGARRPFFYTQNTAFKGEVATDPGISRTHDNVRWQTKTLHRGSGRPATRCARPRGPGEGEKAKTRFFLHSVLFYYAVLFCY